MTAFEQQTLTTATVMTAFAAWSSLAATQHAVRNASLKKMPMHVITVAKWATYLRCAA